MRTKDVIKACKSNVRFGGWKSGPIPKTVFPLTRSGRSLQFGSAYDWQLVQFEVEHRSFRVLLAICFRKMQYYAVLGEAVGKDTRVLINKEFHATHGGWHVHAGCGEMDTIPVGRYKGEWKNMIPREWSKCRQTEWGIEDKDAALVLMCDAFGIEPPEQSAERQMSLI